MGLGGIGTWQLVILLLIVLLIFGTRRIAKIGGDLGAAIKGFRKEVKDDEDEAPERPRLEVEKPSAARSEESVKPSEKP